MVKRILPVLFLGLAVASHGAFAQHLGGAVPPRDSGAQQQQFDQKKQDEQKQSDQYWNGLNPNYHSDDSPNYPFTA